MWMALKHTRQSYLHQMNHLVIMRLTDNLGIPSNATVTSSDSVSFATIFTDTAMSSDTVVFWLILVVALLLLTLKAVKYVLKWKNKKLSTADTIAQLNTVLTEGLQLLSTRTIPPSAPAVQSEIVWERERTDSAASLFNSQSETCRVSVSPFCQLLTLSFQSRFSESIKPVSDHRSSSVSQTAS